MTDQATPTPTGAEGAEAAAAASAAATAAAAGGAAQTPEQVAAAAAAAKPAPVTGVDTALPVADAGGSKGIEYVDTGNAGLNMALKYVASHGFGPEHPAMAAAINGDFSMLRAELAGKDAKGFEAYMTLAENAFTEFDTKHKAQREADTKAVHDIAGGAENWTAVTAWAKENASEEEQTVFNNMLKKGGVEAKIVAQYLSGQYRGSNTPATETDGSGAGVSAVGGRAAGSTNALDPRAYGLAVQEARRAHRGSDFETSAAYKELTERRLRWKA